MKKSLWIWNRAINRNPVSKSSTDWKFFKNYFLRRFQIRAINRAFILKSSGGVFVFEKKWKNGNRARAETRFGSQKISPKAYLFGKRVPFASLFFAMLNVNIKILIYTSRPLKNGAFPVILRLVHDRVSRRISFGKIFGATLKTGTKPVGISKNHTKPTGRTMLSSMRSNLKQTKSSLSLSEKKSHIRSRNLRQGFFQSPQSPKSRMKVQPHQLLVSSWTK